VRGRFYFYTNALKFSAEFIGMISLLDGLAQLLGAARSRRRHCQRTLDTRRGADARARAGVCLYNTFLRNIQLRTVFFWLTLVGVLAGCTQLVLVTGARALPREPAPGNTGACAPTRRAAQA